MKTVYELVALFSPETSEADINKMNDTMTAMVKKYGGKVLTATPWGRKPLAYRIKNFSEAHYVLYELEFETVKLVDFDRALRLMPEVMRYLIVKKDLKKLSLRPEGVGKSIEDADTTLEN